jgi:hypothetical protein
MNLGLLTLAAANKRSRTFQFSDALRIPNWTRCTLGLKLPWPSLAIWYTAASIDSMRVWKTAKVSERVARVSRANIQRTGSSLVKSLLFGGVGELAGAVVKERVPVDLW